MISHRTPWTPAFNIVKSLAEVTTRPFLVKPKTRKDIGKLSTQIDRAEALLRTPTVLGIRGLARLGNQLTCENIDLHAMYVLYE